MHRLSLAAHRHDPYWDMEGSGARRARVQRRLTRSLAWLGALIVLAAALSRLPAIDPEFLVHGDGRLIFGGALLALLAAAALLALVRVRSLGRH